MGSFSMIYDTHYCKKIQLHGGNIPTWKVGLLHTFLAYIQLSSWSCLFVHFNLGDMMY
jgi:hypothetical protein